jgi:hypothetical protein
LADTIDLVRREVVERYDVTGGKALAPRRCST